MIVIGKVLVALVLGGIGLGVEALAVRQVVNQTFD